MRNQDPGQQWVLLPSVGPCPSAKEQAQSESEARKFAPEALHCSPIPMLCYCSGLADLVLSLEKSTLVVLFMLGNE